MSQRRRRGAVGVAAMTLGLALAACGGPTMPASVVKGSKVTLGWTGVLTSANAATPATATTGNLDVAAMTRGRFGHLVKGTFTPDTSFGKVTIRDTKPFTVRYDLAEPTWSDGVPVDAADLLLAWAAGSDLGGDFDSLPTGLAHATKLAGDDESKRSVELTFEQPVDDWNTALDVAVPAHVAGEIAFEVDDPMEAKKAVAEAIRENDTAALAKLAAVWNTGFDLSADHTDPRLLVSSGTYRVTDVVAPDSGGQRVELAVNERYAGPAKPSFERVSLVEMSDEEQVEAIGTKADVIQIAPSDEEQKRFRTMERRDYRMLTSDDGTMWVLVLRADRGPFTRPAARAAFLRAVKREDIVNAGGGASADGYEASNAVVVAPGNDGYDIAVEDSGFEKKFAPADDPVAERNAAGVAPGTAVCLLTDRGSPFSLAAFAALRDTVAAAGWTITDCGERELTDVSQAKSNWQAALVQVPVPHSITDLTRWWGDDPATNLTGAVNADRTKAIATLAATTDIYDARDLRAQIEKTIVDDAVVLPLAMNPRLTVVSPTVDGVSPRPGSSGSLTFGIAEWSRITP